MASPCEVLIEAGTAQEARNVVEAVATCAWRVEDRYSRYRTDNIVHRINTARGSPVTVDDETADLLDFCASLHTLSGGRFDITSGVLREAWHFDGGSDVPSQADIDRVLAHVGWTRARWNRPVLQLQPGMQIDLGGVGKEYAVDRAAQIAREKSAESCLVNFGGDLAISRPRRSGQGWRVGIEAVQRPGHGASGLIELRQGALATSGDTHRFVLKEGKRLTHVLDPRTGWPVEHAPRSVTVAAATCTQAGMLTTLALLHGEQAESFLKQEGVRYWIQR